MLVCGGVHYRSAAPAGRARQYQLGEERHCFDGQWTGGQEGRQDRMRAVPEREPIRLGHRLAERNRQHEEGSEALHPSWLAKQEG